MDTTITASNPSPETPKLSPSVKRIEAGAIATGVADSARNSAAIISRVGFVSFFYGALLGVSVPASPIFYKTFQGSTAAQVRIISQFTAVGAIFSAVPYALFLDNASPGSSSIAPQFNSILSPLAIGVSCWMGGHIWYPGHFILIFEEKGKKLREFVRLTAKTALALHRVHLPFILAWSLAFGVMCRPFKEKKIVPASTTTTTDAVDEKKLEAEGK